MPGGLFIALVLPLALLPPAVATEVHRATGFKVVNVTSGPPMCGPASRGALPQAESVRPLSR